MSKKIRFLVRAALVAAIYTVLCVALAPISYGSLQVRVSEALTLLPVFGPWAVAGVTLGCFLANLAGVFTGANILGALDLVFGTAATLAAALCTWQMRKLCIKKLPLAGAIPPVAFNGAIIGAELCFLIMGRWDWSVFGIQAAWVALGESLAVFVLGLPLIALIQRNRALHRFFIDD